MERFEPVNETVFLLKTPFCGSWSGVTLIRRANENILIDSGASAEVVDAVLIPALAEEGLKLEDLTVLLCTHTHGDHVADTSASNSSVPPCPAACLTSEPRNCATR